MLLASYRQQPGTVERFGLIYGVGKLFDSPARWFAIPQAAVVALLSVLPALWALRSIRRRRRVSAGSCAVCGYDLRATPQRCPECGTPATPPKPQPAEGAAV